MSDRNPFSGETYSAMPLSDYQIGQYAYAAGWRGEDLAIAIALTHPESGGDAHNVQQGEPWATTGWGLWQITPGDPALLDPMANARAAFGKYQSAGGFSPWTTYYSAGNSYKPYLSSAETAAAQVMASGGGQFTPPNTPQGFTDWVNSQTGGTWNPKSGPVGAIANAAPGVNILTGVASMGTSLWNWIGLQAQANLIPLAVAAVILVVLLGVGQGNSGSTKVLPVPV